jgi:hypothetical protein
MFDKINEEQLVWDIENYLDGCAPEELTDLYNNIFGTDYTVDSIVWEN